MGQSAGAANSWGNPPPQPPDHLNTYIYLVSTLINRLSGQAFTGALALLFLSGLLRR